MGSEQSHITHMHTEGFTLVFHDPQKDSHLYFRIHTCVFQCTHKCVPLHIHVNKIQIQNKVLHMYFWSTHICFPFKTAAPANTNRFLCTDRCAFVCGFFETPLTVSRFVLVIISIYSQSDVSSILSQSHEHAPTRVDFLRSWRSASCTHFAQFGADSSMEPACRR